MSNMESAAGRAWDTTLRRRWVLLVLHGEAKAEAGACTSSAIELGVSLCAIQMIVDAESNEGKGGDTKEGLKEWFSRIRGCECEEMGIEKKEEVDDGQRARCTMPSFG